MAFTLAQLAQQLGAQVHGDGTLEIRKVATLEKAGEGDITFLSNKKYRHYLEQSKATAVLITEADLPFCPTNALVLKDPYVGFARVAQLLDTTRSRPRISIRAPSSRLTCNWAREWPSVPMQ